MTRRCNKTMCSNPLKLSSSLILVGILAQRITITSGELIRQERDILVCGATTALGWISQNSQTYGGFYTVDQQGSRSEFLGVCGCKQASSGTLQVVCKTWPRFLSSAESNLYCTLDEVCNQGEVIQMTSNTSSKSQFQQEQNSSVSITKSRSGKNFRNQKGNLDNATNNVYEQRKVCLDGNEIGRLSDGHIIDPGTNQNLGSGCICSQGIMSCSSLATSEIDPDSLSCVSSGEQCPVSRSSTSSIQAKLCANKQEVGRLDDEKYAIPIGSTSNDSNSGQGCGCSEGVTGTLACSRVNPSFTNVDISDVVCVKPTESCANSGTQDTSGIAKLCSGTVEVGSLKEGGEATPLDTNGKGQIGTRCECTGGSNTGSLQCDGQQIIFADGTSSTVTCVALGAQCELWRATEPKITARLCSKNTPVGRLIESGTALGEGRGMDDPSSGSGCRCEGSGNSGTLTCRKDASFYNIDPAGITCRAPDQDCNGQQQSSGGQSSNTGQNQRKTQKTGESDYSKKIKICVDRVEIGTLDSGTGELRPTGKSDTSLPTGTGCTCTAGTRNLKCDQVPSFVDGAPLCVEMNVDCTT